MLGSNMSAISDLREAARKRAVFLIAFRAAEQCCLRGKQKR